MVHSKTGNLFASPAASILACGLSLLLAVDSASLAQDDIPPPPAAPAIAPDDAGLARGSVVPHQNSRAAELWQDKPLGQLKATIALNLPESEQLNETERSRLNQAAPLLAIHGSQFSPLGDSRPWMLTSCEWEAPATRHLPLLFEEPNLERLGYTCGFRTWWCEDETTWHAGPCLQPLISGAHFFALVPLMPYMCGLDEPCEPIYTLGVDRPGTPVPYRRHLIPLDLKASLYEAAAVVGGLYIFP